MHNEPSHAPVANLFGDKEVIQDMFVSCRFFISNNFLIDLIE